MSTLKEARFSFTSGELAPALHSRPDLQIYTGGIKRGKNVICTPTGGMVRTPGSVHITSTKDGTRKARLVPFEFNSTDTYVLEFGHQYVRFIRNGAQVLTPLSAIAETATTYTEDELFELQFQQSADVLTIVHPNHPVRELTRNDHHDWTLAAVTYGYGGPAPPSSLSVTPHFSWVAGGTTRKYKVVSVDIDGIEGEPSSAISTWADIEWNDDEWIELSWSPVSGAETYNVYLNDYSFYGLVAQIDSTGSLGASKAISGITQANPAVVTTSLSHGYSTGNVVHIRDVAGMTEVNNRSYTITVLSATTFELGGEDSTGYTAYTSGGYAQRHGTLELKDQGLRPDLTLTPQTEFTPFDGPGDYPAAVTAHNQRLFFANSDNQPYTIWATRPGEWHNLNINRPSQADSSITWSLASNKLDEIKYVVSWRENLLIFTAGAVWTAQGSQGPLSATDFDLNTALTIGCGDVPPLTIANQCLFAERHSSTIYDMVYSFESDGLAAKDRTIHASHLFKSAAIVDWAYQRKPHGIVWAVTDTGELYTFTYSPEHEVFAWTRTDVDGFVESVSCISEGTDDAVYISVKRTIDGSTVRYIDRVHSATFKETAIEDMIYMHSALSYSGAPATNISGLDHLEGETVAVMADGIYVGAKTVSSGAITLDTAASTVHVGLGVSCEVDLLPFIGGGERPAIGSYKRPVAAAFYVEDTWAFELIPQNDDTAFAAPVAVTDSGLYSGEVKLDMAGLWDSSAGITIRSQDPVPLNILSLIAEYDVGEY